MGGTRNNTHRSRTASTIEKTDKGSSAVNEQIDSSRTDFLLLALKGTLVIIRLSGGRRVEGIYDYYNQQEKLFKLKLVHEFESDSTKEFKKFELLEIPLKDVLSLEAKAVNFSEATGSSGFSTDTDITGKKLHNHERELSRWNDGGIPEVYQGLEETDDSSTGWDQFDANKKLFGVVTSFDENQYTTILDRNTPEYKKIEIEAEKLAKEIMKGSTGSNVHLAEERGMIFDDSQIDEEDRYGAVVRAQPQLSESKKSPVSYKQAASMGITSTLSASSTESATPSQDSTSPPNTRKPRKSIANLNIETNEKKLGEALDEVETTQKTMTRRMSQVAEENPHLKAGLDEQRRKDVFEKQKKEITKGFREFSNKITPKLTETTASPNSTSPPIAKKLNPNASDFVPSGPPPSASNYNVNSVPFNPYSISSYSYDSVPQPEYFNPYSNPYGYVPYGAENYYHGSQFNGQGSSSYNQSTSIHSFRTDVSPHASFHQSQFKYEDQNRK